MKCSIAVYIVYSIVLQSPSRGARDIRSVSIISNRETSNRASQILKANMLFVCPYCLEFQIARVWAAKTNMKL